MDHARRCESCPLSGTTKPPSPALRGEQRRHPADPFPLPLVESVGTLRDGDEHLQKEVGNEGKQHGQARLRHDGSHLEAQNDVRLGRRTAEGEGGGRKAASSPHRCSTADPAVCGSARSFAATAAWGSRRVRTCSCTARLRLASLHVPRQASPTALRVGSAVVAEGGAGERGVLSPRARTGRHSLRATPPAPLRSVAPPKRGAAYRATTSRSPQ